ncbi:hypothetical protein [Mycolicibacterium sp. lyk4-40-TYG-92]|uniref:hypothetical protein n=1 Tax=Mycolicibacterium sp. lyk4-40-TYG-92 TaxID=3040295 RepID=UPI00254ECC14|nr:hypothetical protein [Mycolicibacterium sp. lyk4-40-TYG-92]
MAAELTDSHRGARPDAVPCMTHGRFHLPHTHAGEPLPQPQAEVLKLVTTAPAQRNADVLQARLFIELLEDELAELHLQLAVTERRAAKQGADKHLDVLRRRVAELVAMVDAIVDRFPTA